MEPLWSVGVARRVEWGETVLSGTLIVIGGGQAAVSLIGKLRELGDSRPITLISEEAVPPYQRPPLSKKYLLGEIDLARLLIRPERWYGEHDVTLRLGSGLSGSTATAVAWSYPAARASPMRVWR